MCAYCSMFKRHWKSLTMSTAAGASVLALAAPPAVAASQSQASFYRCLLSAAEPVVSGNGHAITGFGASMCAGTGWQDQKLTVLLLAHPFPTLYEVVARASTSYSSAPFQRLTVTWPCTFTGTRLYTVETSWSGGDGSEYGYKFPAQSVELTCSPG